MNNNNTNTLALTITFILSLLFTPTCSLRNSLNVYHDDGQNNIYNPEIVIFHDQTLDDIRSIKKYDPNDIDGQSDIDVIDDNDDDDPIQDSAPNLVAPPGPIDDDDNNEESDDVDGEFADPSSDQGYSHWFKTESKYISILNFCIIGLSIIFVTCLIYWCYKCGGFKKCPCSCCNNQNDKELTMVYDEDGNYRYTTNSKHKEKMKKERIDISDGEQYMSHNNDNDGTVQTPLLSANGNEFKYQSFDLLSDV